MESENTQSQNREGWRESQGTDYPQKSLGGDGESNAKDTIRNPASEEAIPGDERTQEWLEMEYSNFLTELNI